MQPGVTLELLLRRSPWRPLSRIGCLFPPGLGQAHAQRRFRVPLRPESWARLALIRRSAGAAESVSTQVQDCQQPLASLLVEIVPLSSRIQDLLVFQVSAATSSLLLPATVSTKQPAQCRHLQQPQPASAGSPQPVSYQLQQCCTSIYSMEISRVIVLGNSRSFPYGRFFSGVEFSGQS